MTISRFLTFVTLVAVLPLPASASADTADENRWFSHPVTMSYEGGAYTDREKMRPGEGEILFTTSHTLPGLYFSCIDKRLQAGLVFEPRDMSETFSKIESFGIRGQGGFVPVDDALTYVSAKIGTDKRQNLGKWFYYDDKNAALSRKRKPAAKLYNAVIKGQSVQVRGKSRDWVTLTLPKINADFADFGAACNIGRKRHSAKKAE